MTLTSAQVKEAALRFGADLVGIAGADVLNAFPPDPKYPQTPFAISPEIKSCVAILLRIPVAAFRASSPICVQYMDQLVLRRMDKVAQRLAYFLEEQGHYAFLTAAQETVWEMKKASYGYLSTRHVAIEAGLGTLGLEVNLLTREFGPRCYTTVILTTAELEPDERITEQLCIGESCSRCLYACPADAVLQWGLDKRRCATAAQEFGFSTMLKLFRSFIEAGNKEAQTKLLEGRTWHGIWGSLLEVVGAFGDCPRCLAVCPVGEDYVYLKEPQKGIPEKNEAKVSRAREMVKVRKSGAELPGLSPWNLRWVGEEGYRPKEKAPRARGSP